MKRYTTRTRLPLLLLATGASLCIPAIANAHVGVDSGPATADKTNVVTFGVGHGCAGNDTFSVTIDIPAGVTSVRPMTSDFGATSVEKDDTGAVTSVTWQKPLEEALDSDSQFYTLLLRLKTPDLAFTDLYFKVHQTCRAADGTLSVTEWTDEPDTPIGEQTGEPAARLVLLPARLTGWNKYVVPADIADLSAFFADAQIVWKGESAYSANPHTAALIAGTTGVSALTQLGNGDEIWVKY